MWESVEILRELYARMAKRVELALSLSLTCAKNTTKCMTSETVENFNAGNGKATVRKPATGTSRIFCT